MLVDLVFGFAALLFVAFAIFLARRSRHDATALLIAGYLLTFALLHGIGHILTRNGIVAHQPYVDLAGPITTSLVLALALVYPARRLSGWSLGLALACALPLAIGIAAFAADPAPGMRARSLALLEFGFDVVSYPVGVAAFGWRMLRAKDEAERARLAFLLAPFVLWTFNDGHFVFEWIRDGIVGELFAGDAGTTAVVLVSLFGFALVPILLFLATPLLALRLRSRAWSAILAVVLGSAALSFLQDLGPDANAAHGIHLALDGVVLPMLAYGIARHRIVDVDLGVKLTLRRGSVVAAFLAVFFGVTQVVQETVNDSVGLVAGGLAAAVLAIGIEPLQRAADRFADRVMPQVEDTSSYIMARKLDVYRSAVEDALDREGDLPAERDELLERLRRELGLTRRDHDVLLHALRSRAPPAAPEA